LFHLAEKYGTPYFLIDESTLKRNLSKIEEAFQGFKGHLRVAYSMKANFNPSVVRVFVSEGIMFDLTSAGELYFLQRCGGSPKNVIYTSVTETVAEYETILKLGVKKVVVSSYSGLLNLIDAVKRATVEVDVLLRINPEVRVEAEIRGSMRHGKFGAQLDNPTEDGALNILRKILESPTLKFDGFHFHLGSQIEDDVCYAEALEKLESFILEARRELGPFPVKTIDIGGGMPAPYGRVVPTPRNVASRILGELNSLIQSLEAKFTLIVESGRYLSAESAVLVSRVVNVKKFGDTKFVYIDAGYHTLLDAALLKHEYPVEVIPPGPQSYQKTMVVGRLCDPLDVFPTSSRSKLGGAEPGKLVVFRDVGAYSIVFNMSFHSQPKPYVIMKSTDGNFVVVRKAQTMEELFLEEGGNTLN
jgi:diaminopimelate decarboxylase